MSEAGDAIDALDALKAHLTPALPSEVLEELCRELEALRQWCAEELMAPRRAGSRIAPGQ